MDRSRGGSIVYIRLGVRRRKTVRHTFNLVFFDADMDLGKYVGWKRVPVQSSWFKDWDRSQYVCSSLMTSCIALIRVAGSNQDTHRRLGASPL